MKKVKMELLQKVMKQGTIDTPKYRYRTKETPDVLLFQRIPLNYLDTTKAIDGWELVAISTDGIHISKI